MELLIDIVLLGILGIIAIAIVSTRHLFVATMLSGAYSLASAALLVNLDAVDVAFTEAAVGAGVSTVLMLGTLTLTRRREKVGSRKPGLGPLLLVLATGGMLVYGTLDMPAFGDPEAPAMKHVAPDYIAGVRDDIRMPNIVTAVLASYRGYDTLGETAVVFTACVGVLLMLGRRRDEDEEAGTRRPERRA